MYNSNNESNENNKNNGSNKYITMNNITDYKNNELLPRVFECMDRVFPHLHFERYKGGWGTTYQIDGTEGDTYRPDRCVVTPRFPYYVYSQSRGSRYVIDLYQEYRGGLSFIEAINELCDIVGIEKPHYNEESLEAYKEAEQRRTLLEQSAERQQAALFQPEGKEVLDYLHGRGWTDEDIKNAQLGYVSREEAAQLHNDGLAEFIGDDLKLSIPFRSGSILYGFKLRSIKDKKFINLGGTKKGEHLFNLTGINHKDGTMIVVESELDALLMEARGIKGVVATAGGKLTDNFIDNAKKRGIKIIKLFFDNDKGGYGFTKQSIDLLRKSEIEPFVITIDERYKDAGDFLKEHTIEELQEEIKLAEYGGYYLARKVWNDFVKNEGEIYPERENNLMWEMINLANGTLIENTRLDILHFYTNNAIKHGFRRFTYEELKAIADRDRELKSTLNKAEETKKALEEITKEVNRGNIETGLKMMSEAVSTLSKIDYKAKYSDLLAPMTRDIIFAEMRNIGDDIPTEYTLSKGQDKEVFTLPNGAITIVAAQTSHGKSTFLQNIALQTLESEGEGVVLYFSYEEERTQVINQFLNKYVNENLCKVNESPFISNNLGAIKHFGRTGELRYINDGMKVYFTTKMDKFLTDYCDSGKLQIKYGDFDSSELIRIIRYISGQTKIKAVFVDYIQLLYKDGNKLQRTEELKEICRDLKNLAVEEKLPIVVAAQFNRGTTSPAKMYSQSLGEAGDLERIANKILCIWNSAFTAQDNENNKEISELEARGFILGESGKIYAKLTKNRGGVVGIDAIYDFNGNTGVITDKKYNRATEPTAEQETSKSWHDNEY